MPLHAERTCNRESANKAAMFAVIAKLAEATALLVTATLAAKALSETALPVSVRLEIVTSVAKALLGIALPEIATSAVSAVSVIGTLLPAIAPLRLVIVLLPPVVEIVPLLPAIVQPLPEAEIAPLPLVIVLLPPVVEIARMPPESARPQQAAEAEQRE
jgi:hypothetical protein